MAQISTQWKISIPLPIFSILVFGICLIGLPFLVKAHGDLHERIQATSQEIEVYPDSAFLYFKRGKLYYQHEAFEKAISDLVRAADLGYQGHYSQLVLAKSHYYLANFSQALFYTQQALATSPKNVNALLIKADIFAKQKKYKEAALGYELVIQHARKTIPENYLDAAKAWELSTTPNNIDKAISILQQGIQKLSNLFTLQEKIRSLYIKKNDFEKALFIQQEIISAANRKEFAFQQAAFICLLNGDKSSAKYYLTASLSAIKQLSPKLQATAKVRQLKQQLTSKIKNL